jgi:hypothetical protein
MTDGQSWLDLYYWYLSECKENNLNDFIDPTNTDMEWNHTLPQCLFGDQPLGQYLTKQQHAIASVLQTLAFGHPCVFGDMKKYIPDFMLNLWDLAQKMSGRHSSKFNGQSLKKYTTANPEHQAKAGRIGGVKGVATTTRQQWMSLVDGFISNPGNVAQHNRSIGADPDLRIKLS